MAQTGFTPIQLYSSSTATNVPLAANLATGELAINITDGKLFYKDNSAAVQVIGWKVVPATAGGTGQTSYAVGDLLYANTTTTLAKLADVATGNALISGGIGVAPSWGKIGLTTHVSGVLPVANGGTNLTSFTANGVMYASSTSALTTGSGLVFDGTALGVGGAPVNSRQITAKTAGQTDISIVGGSTNYAQLLFGYVGADNKGIISYYNNDNSMTFYTNGTAQAAITSAGYISTTSKFSIGTAATAGVFHYVVGTNNSDVVAYWANQLSTLAYTGLGNVTYAGGENAADAAFYMRKGPATSRSLNAAGTVNAAGLDYAEYMEKSGDFTIAKGDICGIDANGKLTNVFADALSFVIKSTNPSYVGGDNWGNESAIGLTKPQVPSQREATKEIEAETNAEFAVRQAQYETDKTAFDAALETARQRVDRIAFCGQVPINVLGATPGQYIIPVNDNGAIKGEAVGNPTFEQYQQAVGKVIAIESDGRAKIIVKVS